jgi:prolyl oligopeptidase
VLTRVPGRDAYLARITYLDSKRTMVGTVQTYGKYVFYEKQRPQDNEFKLYVRTGFTGRERLLVDPEKLNAKGTHYAIDWYVPSLDGSYVAYGLSTGGSEASVLHILTTATGALLPEAIDRTEEAGVSWLPDGKSFFYNRLKKILPGEDPNDKYSDSAVYLHRLGTDVAKTDKLIVRKGVNKQIALQDIDVPSVAYTPGAPQYVFATCVRGTQNEFELYVAPVADLTGSASHIPWVQACSFDDDVTGFDVHGNKMYLLSHKGAPHFKVVTEPVDAPDFASAVNMIPESKTVLTGLNAASDALYVHGRDNAVGYLGRIPYGAQKLKSIPLPFVGALDPAIFSDVRVSGVQLATESGTHSPAWYRYDPSTATLGNTGLVPPVPVDFSHVSQVEVAAKAADGTMVPLSIIYPKNMKFDGSHPTLIDAYGAYSIVSDMGYMPTLLAWIEKGGVYAEAHVRGGGELGEDWYRGGFKQTKPNSWNDLIACGRYMVSHGYTRPSRLACTGGSAGGITVGRAITTQPQLWGAAVIDVGSLNAIRQEFSPNGPDNVPEFGSISTEQGFKDLYNMDSTVHVRSGVAYPAVLLTTGINDPRVAPWEPAKMTAHLQAVERALPRTQRRPILLRVDFDAGHGYGSTKKQELQEAADRMSFLLWQFHAKGF